jgi:hypothetical protein
MTACTMPRLGEQREAEGTRSQDHRLSPCQRTNGWKQGPKWDVVHARNLTYGLSGGSWKRFLVEQEAHVGFQGLIHP